MTALQLCVTDRQTHRHVLHQQHQSTGLLGMQREHKMYTCLHYIFKLTLHTKPQITSDMKLEGSHFIFSDRKFSTF